jgi:hypothetical protein
MSPWFLLGKTGGAMRSAFSYAQARLQARHARRADRALWIRLEASRSLDHYLESARGTSLEPWLKSFGRHASLHEIEPGLRAAFRGYALEVASWLPARWQASVAWAAELVELPTRTDRRVADSRRPVWELAHPPAGQRRGLSARGDLVGQKGLLVAERTSNEQSPSSIARSRSRVSPFPPLHRAAGGCALPPGAGGRRSRAVARSARRPCAVREGKRGLMGLKPRTARWFELLTPTSELALTVEALARSGAAQIEASRGAPPLEHVAELTESLTAFDRLRQRYAPYFPKDALRASAGGSPVLLLQEALVRLAAWAKQADPLIVRLEKPSRATGAHAWHELTKSAETLPDLAEPKRRTPAVRERDPLAADARASSFRGPSAARRRSEHVRFAGRDADEIRRRARSTCSSRAACRFRHTDVEPRWHC